MKKFKILAVDHATNKEFTIKAVHTDTLDGRKGYDTKYLGKELPLPKLPAAEKSNAATLPDGSQELKYSHFSVVFNKAKKLPFFTAVNIDGTSDLMGLPHEERKSDVWFPDDRIKVGKETFQFGNGDYNASGFDKGHMVRYFDPAWGSTDEIKKQAMGDTFHYTNCCPQIHHFNGVIWNYLEDYYMARAIFKDKKVTIFSGPIFNKAKKIGKLLVPVNFWKVVVYKNPDKSLSAMGFVMSQENYLNTLTTERMVIKKVIQPKLKPADIERLYQKQEIIDAKVKISFIEEKTNLKFGLTGVDENKSKPQGFYQLLYKADTQRVMTIEKAIAQKDLTSFFAAM